MGGEGAEAGPRDALPVRVRCWACCTEIEFPATSSGEPPRQYACGHCGAYGETPSPQPGSPDARPQRFRTWRGFLWAGVGYVLVPIVFALIAWLTHAAATLVEQHFLTGHPTLARLHSAWCLYLSVNITLHYLVSIFTRPATVQPSPAVLLGWRDPAAVPSGHYAGYRYCSKCRFFKPPDAHHCSSCGHCVRGMDHHCPFVANCVGSKTMRPFLLFVFWAAVGTGWSGAVCLAALATDPWGAVDSLSQHSLARTFRAQYGRSSAFVHLGHGPGPSGFAAAVARMLFVVPTHIGVVLSAWGMMAILGGVFGIVLSGMLLSLGLSTLSLAIRGTSLISNLQGDAEEECCPFNCNRGGYCGSGVPHAEARANLRAVFGPGGWWSWLLVPRISALPPALEGPTLKDE